MPKIGKKKWENSGKKGKRGKSGRKGRNRDGSFTFPLLTGGLATPLVSPSITIAVLYLFVLFVCFTQSKAVRN